MGIEIQERVVDGVTVQYCPEFPFPHGFSTRLGGVSREIWASMNLGTTRGDAPDAVRENYRRFCKAIGTDVTAIAMSNQIHSDVIRTVTRADMKADLYDPEGYEVDGLITDLAGICLVIFSADCIPVLFCDPVRRVIAAVHAGWRGTAAAIGAKAVERMVGDYGCHRGDILAAIGPGISRCCFETHSDVPDAMTQALGPGVEPYIQVLPGEKFQVDLKGINRHILMEHGVTAEHIAVSGDCTACLPEKYWSHRMTQGKRGSQAAMIQL